MQVRNNSYLFNCVRKQTLERRPESIVKGRQVFWKEDLARIAIHVRKSQFGEN